MTTKQTDIPLPATEIDRRVKAAMDTLSRLSKQAQSVEAAVEAEQARWQTAIYDYLTSICGDSIDGGGCDSGDPLDFTMDEIRQAIGVILDRPAAGPSDAVLRMRGIKQMLGNAIYNLEQIGVELDREGIVRILRQVEDRCG
jgi:hypothetical protein